MKILPYIWFFIFGTALGSFYNVLADRLPDGRDIVFERSSCSECATKLRWYDLIPVVSYITLKGKCRYCGAKLSPWYLISELIVGSLFTFGFALFAKSPDILALILNLVFWSLLYIVAVMDWKSGYIMDIFPIIIGISGIIAGFINHREILEIILGGVVGGACFGVIYIGARLILKREGLGLGDVFLLAGIGFWFSWKEIIVIAFLTAYVALIFIAVKAIVHKNVGMKTELPLGPSICIAAFLMSSFGSYIMKFVMKITGLY